MTFKFTHTLTRPLLCGLLAASLLGTAGCSAGGSGKTAFFNRLSGVDSVETQLSGEALSQRKYSMRRIRRDLGSFRQTLEQLDRHGKTAGINRFEQFVRPFIEMRVDPLIHEQDKTSHPELRPFKAELLLSKAVLMHAMEDPRAVKRTIGRLENEFAGVTSMLVLYPTGEAVTLEQSIALLRMQTGEI
ncbi:MAG: hypothetical protein AB8G23_07815 [Myxococcota bacterium]